MLASEIKRLESLVSEEMTRYNWCRYVFAKGSSGRYVYRIQLLPSKPSAQDAKDYLGFLEDSRVEIGDTYRRWVYVRKEANGQPFDLFSDFESRVAHHKRIATLFVTITAGHIPLFAVIATRVIAHPRDVALFSTPLFVAYVALLGYIAVVALRHLAAARRLEGDSLVHE